ncbi:DsrE family protein [Alteraurantiacibacter aquimixticola]|nr:DsrE family protein [Alteraurantiacibacter aquimixticola]
MRRLPLILAMALSLVAAPALAQERMSGPVFTKFGSWRPVENNIPVPADGEIKAIFDIVRAAEPGQVNGRIDSAARFVNLLVHAGVPEENVKLAIVLHGPSIRDVTHDAAYGAANDGASNASAAAIAEMIAHGVQFYVCGQSALSQGITAEDLLPGVLMTYSQTVTTALLHQQGYQNIP